MRRQLSRGEIHKQSIADHLCGVVVYKKGQEPFKQLLSNIKRCYSRKM